MKIFDMHVHIFPDRIAEKAVNAIGVFYENFNMEGDGRLESAIRAMDGAGITRCAAHSVATTAHQVDHINDFVMAAHERYPDRIMPFAAMHPGLPDAAATAEAVIARGFKGVKLHPEIQGFKIDAPEVLDMLAPFEGKLPILVHCGDYRYDNSCPDRIKHVLRVFPRLRLICAHLGGWTVWKENARQLIGQDVYVDTSSALFALTPDEATQIIRGYGVERAIYGTDFPMWTPAGELERFDRLDLTEDERRKILWDNHLQLFDEAQR
ncbi:MAG: amidohydrolase family protein [Clostridia bacterium]|nr:amidohydrolase family protein [Clostridia bacterium]